LEPRAGLNMSGVWGVDVCVLLSAREEVVSRIGIGDLQS